MPEALIEAQGSTFTLTPGSGPGTFAVIGGGPGTRRATQVLIRASGGNSGTGASVMLWGWQSPQQEIAPGEAIAIDIPRGHYVDLTKLTFSGNGLTGQIVYVSAILLD